MTENQGEVRTKRIRKADISTRSWQRHSTSVEVGESSWRQEEKLADHYESVPR
jgi:hypothetical protein